MFGQARLEYLLLQKCGSILLRHCPSHLPAPQLDVAFRDRYRSMEQVPDDGLNERLLYMV